MSNVIRGFRGYLHGKEACIVNLPVGRISCPSSYLICMPLLDPQQQLNCQLIPPPNEMVYNRTLTSGLSTLISVLKWPIFLLCSTPIWGDSLWVFHGQDLSRLKISPCDFTLQTDYLTNQQQISGQSDALSPSQISPANLYTRVPSHYSTFRERGGSQWRSYRDVKCNWQKLEGADEISWLEKEFRPSPGSV